MATITDILSLINLETGESAYDVYGNWGAVADANFAALEAALGEVTSKALTGANVTLTTAEARSSLIKLTGILSANVEVRVPDKKGFWFVSNACTGDFTMTFKTTSGTGVVIPNGSAAIVASDGTNVLPIATTPAGGSANRIKRAAKAVGFTAVLAEDAYLYEVSATLTMALTAAATLGDRWSCMVKVATGATLTIDPNGAETINGAATLTLGEGYSALIVCNGTNFTAVILGTGNVTLTGIETLTNKTLTSPTVNTPAVNTPVITAPTIRRTDDGAAGPVILTEHISASPAASDVILSIDASAKDSAANTDIFAQARVIVSDPTSASEDSYWSFLTRLAGTLAERIRVTAGLIVGAPTGGDQGAGTVNATEYYRNGVRITGAPDVVIQNKQTSGTGGDNATTTFTKLTLNSEIRDPLNLCTLSSSQMTFASDGWVEWDQEGYTTRIKTKLRNVTDSTDIAFGSQGYSNSGPSTGAKSTGCAPVVAGKVYELQGRGSGSQTDGFGVASSLGEEIYATVKYWRG